MTQTKHMRLRRADKVDHLDEIAKYLEATKGLWPRIARELEAAGVKMTVQGLSVLCNRAKTTNPEYRRVMAVYAYIVGPGRRWLPIVSRKVYAKDEEPARTAPAVREPPLENTEW
jgi:hypothetical protein